MFGLFYIASNLLGVTISGTKRFIENSHYKEIGWEKYKNGTDLGKHTYYDAEGRERDLSTNNIMFTYKEHGDLFIKDTKTSKIRNLSEEKRVKVVDKVKNDNPNMIAIFYKYWDVTNSELKDGDIGIPGKVFKDINNGSLYFERYITWRKNDFAKSGIIGDCCYGYFYLRVSDGKIVSISDRQKEIDRDSTYDDFISFFNSEQSKGGFVVRNRNPYAKSKTDFYIGNEMICNK